MKFFNLKDENFIELLKGSSISFILKILGMLFGYFAMLFVTNFYGAEEWGIYALCFTILSIVVLLPKFGFSNSLVRIIAELNINKRRKEIVEVLFKSLTISLLISLLIIVLINVFSDYIVYDILKKAEMKQYINLISFSILPIVILAIISATFQALKKTALFILFQTTLINIVFFLLLIICYWKDIKISIFELYFYAIFAVFFVAIFSLIAKFAKREIKDYPIKRNIKYSYKLIAKISLPMLLSNSFLLLMGWSDIIMLSYYQSSADIGIYDSALKLAMLSTIPLIAINAIATPNFVEFYSKKDMQGLKNTVQNSTKLIFLTATPVLLILVFFSKEILGFFGEEFVAGYLALIYLCVSRFINAISGSVGYIMQMTDQQIVFKNVLIIAFIINILLNFVLIPIYSFTGAAIASSIAMIFWNITLAVIIKKRLGFWTIYLPLIKI